MKQRIITAIMMAAIFIPIVIFGDRFFIFFTAGLLLCVAAAYEFRNMLANTAPVPKIIDIATILFTALFYVIGYFALTGNLPLLTMLLYLGLLIVCYLMLFVLIPEMDAKVLGEIFLTILYVGSGFLSLAYIRFLGLNLLIYVLLIAILTDTFAYFIGMKFGKHRLAEKISPKKSVEGAIAGLVIGGSLAALFAILTDIFSFGIVFVFILSFYLSAIGQVGDLVASKFKRNHGIKDFSQLFPGHGGVLDRFDSWIFVALNQVLITLIIAFASQVVLVV